MNWRYVAAMYGVMLFWSFCTNAYAVTVDATNNAKLNYASAGGPYDFVNGTIVLTFPVGDPLDPGDSIAVQVYDSNNNLLFSQVNNGPPFPSPLITFGGTLNPVLTTSTFYILLSALAGSVELDSNLGLDVVTLSCGPNTCSEPTFRRAAPSSVESIAATPLPAALPLFVTGLGALGLLGWRKKRKQAA